jgi:broad specificity phosphatase PhoE
MARRAPGELVVSTGRHNQVVLVRHGATDWSENGRHTGRTDLPLSDRGRQEALAVTALLEAHSPALVLVSPLERARETCRLVGLLDRAEIDDDLREWDYGDLEGLTTPEIRENLPGWTVWSGPVPGGETIEEVASRTDRVIERTAAAPGEVMLFAHGHVLRVLAARWCELDPREGKRFPLATGTLCVLGWEHEYRAVRLWNRHA